MTDYPYTDEQVAEQLKRFKPTGWSVGGTLVFRKDGSVKRFGGVGGIFDGLVDDKPEENIDA